VNEKGLVMARAEIANPGMLMEGMNVEVLVRKELIDKLVVPKSAVVLRQNQEVLFQICGWKSLLDQCKKPA
jgi:membrane fusion protein, multidrug efflux system